MFLWQKYRLTLNSKKTKILSNKSIRVTITGLVLSPSKYDFGNDAIGIGRHKKRVYRSQIFNLLSSPNPKEIDFIKFKKIQSYLGFLQSVDHIAYNQLARHYNQNRIRFQKMYLPKIKELQDI